MLGFIEPVAADKSMGQHWLVDESVVEAAADMAEISPSDTILEIGPGLGILTKELSSRAAKVIAVEYDALLYQLLAKASIPGNIELINADFLDYDLRKIRAGYKVCANLPYNISAKTIAKLITSSNPPDITVLLLQKEVADQLAVKPGKHSLLSIATQSYCEVKLGREVLPASFNPQPRVNSRLVKLSLRTGIDPVLIEQGMKLARAAYNSKRKMLTNTLIPVIDMDKAALELWLERRGLSPKARPQELAPKDWQTLALDASLAV